MKKSFASLKVMCVLPSDCESCTVEASAEVCLEPVWNAWNATENVKEPLDMEIN